MKKRIAVVGIDQNTWCPFIFIVIATLLVIMGMGVAMAATDYINETQITTAINKLKAIHTEVDLVRLERGVRQTAHLWREEDGNADGFATFCERNFIADEDQRQKTTDRLESALASIYGHMGRIRRDLSWNLDIETGPLLPIDYELARYSPYTHLSEDMFNNKIAFIVLLNYPQYSLSEIQELGPTWTRQQWAEARLAESFSSRVPPEASQKISEAYLAASNYISQYNIWMHHLLTPDGERLFPEGQKLVTHWNLRDELKAQYGEDDGLVRQEMIYNVMNHIIRQDIPEAVINNPAVDWKPSTGEVFISSIVDGDPREGWKPDGAADNLTNNPEPNTRYQHLLNIFKAQQLVDPYNPKLPTMIDRRFERNREMKETEVEQLLTSILGSNVMPQIGKLIKKRLSRDLRPFDIWYDGFKARSAIGQDELDQIVREKYPTVEAFETDIPNILQNLGFDKATAQFLDDHIDIDPSRGIGHAAGPPDKNGKARLRTRVTPTGMDYKGYNIAMHEFGHNVEQVFSTCRIDHTQLRGVPNTAFTEAFAFVFQSRDLWLLGIENDNPDAQQLKVLDDVWGAYEISGVSLVDMRVWRWMYANPQATPIELKEAIIQIAKDVWNEYFAPVFGIKDIELLAVYSHMISSGLYLPDYPIGSVIEFQIEEYLKDKDLATEMERMCTQGSLTPDMWMQMAVGNPITTEPMLKAAAEALEALAE